MNRLQKGLINSRIALRALRLNCQKKMFLNRNAYFFFSNSNRNFYSENNNVSQVYTYIPKIQKNIQYVPGLSLQEGKHFYF
jgi:hypothetical protein